MSSHKTVEAGQVVEAFSLAIQDFLIFYQHQVNELESKLKAHRQIEDDTLSKSLTLLEIKVLMAPLLSQISTIASICFTSKFIEDIQIQQQYRKAQQPN